MASTADQTINYQSPLNGMLQQLLGQQTSGSQNGSTTTGSNTAGTNTTTSTADLAPLLQIFSQASAGMSPEQASALISSIFQEGAQKVPELTGAYANATGSRSSNNSTLKLALDELNKSLSTQAMSALLNFNQGSQQTAANAAGNIAANTRQQTQTNNQVQTGTQQQSTQTQQQQGVNKQQTGLLGGLLAAGSLASKMGLLPSFGKAAGGATGTPGTITGGGSLVPNAGGTPTLLGGSPTASSGLMPTSSGFLDQPVASNPYGVSSGIGGGGFSAGSSGGASLPSFNFGNGITGMGGFSGSNGLLGNVGDLQFGGLAPSFNAFGTLGTDSLGTNLNFGSNPYDYGGTAGGITGAVGGAGGGIGDFFSGAAQSAASGLSDVGSWITGGLSGIGDFIGSFFADGGQVANRGFGAPGDTRYMTNPAPAPTNISGNIFDVTRMRNEMQAGLQPMPQQMQPGTNVMVPAGTPGMPVSAAAVMQLLPFLLGKGLGFADGGQLGYADGGQVETGGSARVRNQNYMGPQLRKEQQGAINYEGYAPVSTGTAGVGASTPAGGSPSLAAAPAALAAPTAAGASAISGGDPNAQAWAQFNESLAKEAMMNAIRGGGSGGVGEGASPGQDEGSNGQAGIGPSGIAAAPNGTTNAVSGILGLLGLSAPGLSQMLQFMSMMASAVNAANQASAGGNGGVSGASQGEGPTTATVSVGPVGETPGISSTVGLNGLAVSPDSNGSTGNGIGGGVGVGASGGPGSGGDGGPGDSGVGGDSAGDGTSGSAGTSAGGDAWADGGMVRGAGTGTSDSIRVNSKQPGGKTINYSDGEYVIPADVVQALGVNHFDSLLAAFHTPVNR